MSWLIVLAGYLIGAIPAAYIAGRLVKGEDIRAMGDSNVGARNAFVELGHKTGVGVFAFDAAKGAAVIVIARAVGLSQAGVLLSGVAAVVGHNWPVYIGFRGGRGEATTIGILFVLLTIPMLILTVPAIATLIFKKNVILTSAAVFTPLWLVSILWGVPASLIAYSIALPCLVAFTHFLRTRRGTSTDVEAHCTVSEDATEARRNHSCQ